MALIECPECKAQISDQAAACPQCGFAAAVAAQESAADVESSPISDQPSADSLPDEVAAASTDAIPEEPAAAAADPPAVTVADSGHAAPPVHKQAAFRLVVLVLVVLGLLSYVGRIVAPAPQTTTPKASSRPNTSSGSSATSRPPTSTTVDVTAASPAEAKIASIQVGTRTVERRLIQQFDAVLSSLESKCQQRRDTTNGPSLTDIAVFSVGDLAKNGKTMTHLAFLGAMEESIIAGMPRLDCMEIAAALLTRLE